MPYCPSISNKKRPSFIERITILLKQKHHKKQKNIYENADEIGSDNDSYEYF